MKPALLPPLHLPSSADRCTLDLPPVTPASSSAMIAREVVRPDPTHAVCQPNRQAVTEARGCLPRLRKSVSRSAELM